MLTKFSDKQITKHKNSLVGDDNSFRSASLSLSKSPIADPAEFIIKFVNQKNISKYKEAVLAWLKSDFEKLKQPKNHFWHNRSTISSAFDKDSALVVLNNQNAVIAYMIWCMPNDARAEIDIIEVKQEYRRQGIFRRAFSAFVSHFPNVVVLTATVLSQAEEAFSKAGWTKVEKKHFKIIRPVLEPSNELPNGHVIALSLLDFYKVKENREAHKGSMKYFTITLDKDNKLQTPIVTEHHYDGYVGIYLNKRLIAEGKAKHLFQGVVCEMGINLFVLNEIVPLQPELFKEFLSEKHEPLPAGTMALEISNKRKISTENDIVEQQPKKQRKNLNFKSSESLTKKLGNIKEKFQKNDVEIPAYSQNKPIVAFRFKSWPNPHAPCPQSAFARYRWKKNKSKLKQLTLGRIKNVQ